MGKRSAIAVAILAVMLALPPPGYATFPGENGKLVLMAQGDGCHLYTINPDGSNLQQITDSCPVGEPVWSPDGTRIAYAGDGDIHIINANGSGGVNVTSGLGQGGEWSPSWSPDGTRIAYERATIDPETNLFEEHVWTSSVDGTGHTELAPAMCRSRDPLWHPGGTRIAFRGMANREPDGTCFPDERWYLINADGTGQVELPADGIDSWSPDGSKVSFFDPPCGGSRNPPCQIYVQPADGSAPATAVGPAGGGESRWSPDGTKLAFKRSTTFGGPAYLWMMNADGSGVTQLTTFGVGDVDWQAIPVNAYPRPKGASPTDVPLVPAYEPCAAPNRTHGPPLAFPSCNPPAQKPGQLTVGTPDANGRPAKLRSNVRINPLRGLPSTPADEADVRLRATVNDVRLRSDLSDYTGDLELRLTLQITDRDNTPHPGGPGPATVQELTHAHPLPCSPTADTTVGSTCQFDTTIEALVPGAVKELQRAIWELRRIEVRDGNGDPYLTQGIFVP